MRCLFVLVVGHHARNSFNTRRKQTSHSIHPLVLLLSLFPFMAFRPCVAVLIVEAGPNPSRALACLRIDLDHWQCVQGGIDPGEDLLVAAAREIYEEIGLRAVPAGSSVSEADVMLIGEVTPPNSDESHFRYLWPDSMGGRSLRKKYVGAQQRLVLGRCDRHCVARGPPRIGRCEA